VGCGDGLEADFLAAYFECPAVGIDLGQEFAFAKGLSSRVQLFAMDAREMDFENESFDFVYSFHALEHIPSPERALKEMNRVLKRNGAYLIGTPNRHRLVGYVNCAASWRDRIAGNLADLKYRLQGKFRNEFGAHAGFSIEELQDHVKSAFGPETEDVSAEYYSLCYNPTPIKVLRGLHVSWLIFPCVYVFGRKR
jgi:ubiquinone/menaquinone biosynthesis C-methylase UbiE